MRITLVGLVALCSVALGADVASEYNPPYDELLSHTVVIEDSYGDDAWSLTGTGVVIKLDSRDPLAKFGILTANHVLRHLEDPGIARACSSLHRQSCVPLILPRSNGSNLEIRNDWKVYSFDHLPSSMHPVSHLQYTTQIGEDVYQIGYPSANLIVNKAQVAAHDWDNDHKMIVLFGMVARGSSGGPVFTTDGKLLGIVSAMPLQDNPKDESISDPIWNLVLVVPVTERILK